MNDYIKTMRPLVGSRPMLLPGVRALISNPQGEILLQRRTDMPRWCLPSGSVELDETALDALKREVSEETSLVVLEAEPMGLYSGPSQKFAYPNGDEIQCFSIAFLVRRWQGDPRADGVEGSELRFFAPSRMPDELVAIHKSTIEDYQTYRGKFILR
ncbi:MAG: NUDIX domain-containing protein [Pirellulales bacterium]|nr:NUDIX domain-containing protein [Pirellulales bacterium]